MRPCGVSLYVVYKGGIIMKKISFALQLYTVRDFLEKDFEGTIKQVKEIGYKYVELAGMCGVQPEKLKSVLDANSLTVLSAHVPYNELSENTDKTIKLYKSVGCRFIAIPWISGEIFQNTNSLDNFTAEVKKIGEICGENDVTLLYHNHDFEFCKLPNGAYGLDYFYEHVPPGMLQTQIDTCWVKVAGLDPAAYIRKYAGRCPVVHLKDFYIEGVAEGMYELVGQENDGQKEKTGVFEFRPVGHGLQDFPSIYTASRESGAEWAVVEQDLSVGRTSLEAAKLSYEYIQSQGWA